MTSEMLLRRLHNLVMGNKCFAQSLAIFAAEKYAELYCQEKTVFR